MKTDTVIQILKIMEMEEEDPNGAEALSEAIRFLTKARWIPVTKRSPEKNDWYQCTVILDNLSLTMDLYYRNGKWLDNRRIDMFNLYDIYGYGNTNERHKLSYQEFSEFDWTENVIAWMPLPQPYKEAEG